MTWSALIVLVPSFLLLLAILEVIRLAHERDELRKREQFVIKQVEAHKELTQAKIKGEFSEREQAIGARELEATFATNRLEDFEATKSKFVSVTAHQMRTPLAAIKWTFHMLSKGDLGPITDDQKTFIDKGLLSTDRMIRIVNDLLLVDTSPDTVHNLNLTAVDLKQLVATIVQEFMPQALSKKIKLQFISPDQSLPTIKADAGKLRMVVENLLDNAIKYTPVDGEVTVNLLDTALNSPKPSLELVVADSGIGIKSTDQAKIFNKFFRAGNAVSMEPDGSGLGLYICKDIVKKHGGTMWFQSPINGGGTAFHLLLPLVGPIMV
ncbi:MAG: HAMP domain-containing histidine kinase [Candidatus Vogelbacteria bacterium]|nr:HAMP domain-containing histidine kinase [Candidatus Vogelbacteria bacterium]